MDHDRTAPTQHLASMARLHRRDPRSTQQHLVRRTAHRSAHLAPDRSVHSGRHRIYCSAIRQPHALLATKLYYRNFLSREVLYFQRNANRIHLDLPILHINGTNDPLTQQLSAAYRDHAPNMALHNFPGCGHFIAEERPLDLIDRITAFF